MGKDTTRIEISHEQALRALEALTQAWIKYDRSQDKASRAAENAASKYSQLIIALSNFNRNLLLNLNSIESNIAAKDDLANTVNRLKQSYNELDTAIARSTERANKETEAQNVKPKLLRKQLIEDELLLVVNVLLMMLEELLIIMMLIMRLFKDLFNNV